VYDVLDSASAQEINPEVLTLTPGTPCIHITIFINSVDPEVRMTIRCSVKS